MDRAVSAAYEPGSTFKVITLTGAIENGVTTPDDLIDCQMGQIIVAGRLIHDWQKFGMLSVARFWSIPAMWARSKLRCGSARRASTTRFASSELASRPASSCREKIAACCGRSRIGRPSSIGSLAMGQEVSVTPIQIISAISAVANGGTLYRPHIVQRNSRRRCRCAALRTRSAASNRCQNGGDDARDDGRRGSRRHRQTRAAAMATRRRANRAQRRRLILPRAAIQRRRYNSSFVGFAPVNNPAITILVVLDSPVGAHHGGEVGGPVFKRVAEQVLAYLDVPHDVPTPSDVETAKNLQPLAPTSRLGRMSQQTQRRSAFCRQPWPEREESGQRRNTVAFGDQDAIAVPNLAGRTVRGVTEECSRLGLDAVVDWQRSCIGAVSRCRDAGPARQPGDGAIRTAREFVPASAARGAGIELCRGEPAAQLELQNGERRDGKARHETAKT